MPNQLQQRLNNVNKRYADVLASPLAITLRDEFQALFKNTNQIWKIVFFIDSRLPPTGFRFGFGTGDMLTDVDTTAAIGMDGPASYNARDAIHPHPDPSISPNKSPRRRPPPKSHPSQIKKTRIPPPKPEQPP